MNILLTGGSGFVGTNLVPHLIKNNNVDIVNLRGDWSSTISEARHDAYIHLAGKAHDHKGKFSEKDFFDINVGITKDLFTKFLNSDASIFLHLSSIAAVEEEGSDFIIEEDFIGSSKSAYGISKREAEVFLLSSKLPENKKLIIIRPTMIHGPGDKGNLVLLYKIISKGIPYPLGAYNNKRSFVSIDNLCFLVSSILENKEKLVSGVYNFADDETLSTSQIITKIGVMTGRRTRIFAFPKFIIKNLAILGDKLHLPLNTKRLGKMTSNLVVSNHKVKTMLGIQKLPVTAEDGLAKTISSFINK